jgi:hypothetical protein
MSNRFDDAPDLGRRHALAVLGGLGLTAALPLPMRARAGESKEFQLLMTPQASGVYNAYAVFQIRVKDHHSWLQFQTVETGGFNYNVSYVARFPGKWLNTAFGSATVLEAAAQAGIKPFYEEPVAAVKDFRVLGGMGATGNFFVTLDPKIRTPKDFVGKRVSTGLLTQNEWGMYQRMLLDGWGLTDKLASLNPLGPDKNIDALLDGRVDVATMVSFFTPDMNDVITAGPFKKLVASGRRFYYVHIPPEMIESYNAEHGMNFEVRHYKPDTLENQPEAFDTFGDYMTVSAHKDFSEELAYEFTKLWVEMGPVVAKYNALGKVWTPEGIAHPVLQNQDRAHPGALRALKEKKLI